MRQALDARTGPGGSDLLIWRAETRRPRKEDEPEALGLRRVSPLWSVSIS